MILEFFFSKVHNNGVLENLLDKILHKIAPIASVESVIKSEKNSLSLYVEAKQGDLEVFSDEFSKLLPISLFYKFIETKIVDSMPKRENIAKCNINIPFTHTMLTEFLDNSSKNYLNLSLTQDVGKSLKDASHLTYKDIEEAINHLKDGNCVQICTRFGIKSIGIVDNSSKEILSKNDFTIMPCDLSLLQKMVVVSENELKALASLEKPTISMRVNLIYKNKNIIPTSWVDVRICDTLILFLLCKRLYENGEEFIYIVDESNPCSFSLTYYQKEFAKALKINVLENGESIVIGENEYNQSKKLPYFEQKAHERFTSILYEYNLFEDKSICFFLSKKHDDKAMFYSQKLGLVDLISVIKPITINELIDAICQNENGKKLIQNYKKTYSDIFQKALHVKIPSNAPNNFYTLIGIVGVLLGYGDDLQTSAQTFLSHAKNFSGPKGPRIDVKLKKEKFPDFINVEKFVQSGLSFRLAEVDDETLCYGYMESISFFVSDMADVISKEFDTNNISLCGQLFDFQRLLEVSAKNIQPNHKVFINRAFSIE